jgi:hypothetical protein
MFVAYMFTLLTLIVIVFQFALALGAPWGEYTLAGKYPGKLPPKLKLAAVMQILVLVVFSLIMLTRSGLILEQFFNISRVAIWFVAGFFILGSATNLTSPSQKEKLLWGPVNIILLILSILTALS